MSPPHKGNFNLYLSNEKWQMGCHRFDDGKFWNILKLRISKCRTFVYSKTKSNWYDILWCRNHISRLSQRTCRIYYAICFGCSRHTWSEPEYRRRRRRKNIKHLNRSETVTIAWVWLFFFFFLFFLRKWTQYCGATTWYDSLAKWDQEWCVWTFYAYNWTESISFLFSSMLLSSSVTETYKNTPISPCLSIDDGTKTDELKIRDASDDCVHRILLLFLLLILSSSVSHSFSV